MVDALATGDLYRAQEAFFRHVERSKSRFLSTVAASEADLQPP
jgi:DNA-binding GntR family transcriptional regulator